MPPVIVPDEQAPETQVPEVGVLDRTRIGTMNIDGVDADNTVLPPEPLGKGSGEVIAPKVQEMDYDGTFTKVEIPAQFPGGAEAWRRYLERYLKVPEDAIDNGINAVVRVQFIIDKEGNISEVTALNNPGYGLAEEAVRIIAKGPKWIPAEQNDRKVRYQHVQAIHFKVD